MNPTQFRPLHGPQGDQPDDVRFNAVADAELSRIYEAVGATTTQHKINTLALHLGGIGNFTTEEQEIILGALECEYLSNKRLIELDLA